MQAATVTLFYDTRRATGSLFFVRLSVYADRKQKLFSTGEKISPKIGSFWSGQKAVCPEQ